jgi:hypothetical protein
MNQEQQRRYDLAVKLIHARKQLAAVPADDLGERQGVQAGIRHIQAELGWVDERALAELALKLEEQEAERKRIARERAYERTGVVQQ